MTTGQSGSRSAVPLATLLTSTGLVGLGLARWLWTKHQQQQAGRALKSSSSYSNLNTPLSTPALDFAAQRLFLLPKEGSDGVKELLIPDKTTGRVSKVKIRQTKASTLALHKRYFQRLTATERVGVNANFFKQLRAILRIVLPRLASKEAFLLIIQSAFLIFRTVLSILGAQLDGVIVRNLISGNGKGFLLGLVKWYLLALPSSYTNSILRFLQSKISIAFRTRLTRYVHDLYLSKERNYYKALNLDNRLESLDQYITADVAHFCDTLSGIYSNLSKPLLDLVLFNAQLARSIGKAGTIGLFFSYLATARILRALTPAFGKLAAVEAKLEGDFRGAHARVVTNSEEIAFYDGGERERGIITQLYLQMVRHINGILKLRIYHAMQEDLIIKYIWSSLGYCLISIPVFWPGAVSQLTSSGPTPHHEQAHQVADRTENYIANRRILVSLADAGSRLMYSGRDLAELAGYTSRVYNLLSTLHLLNNNQLEIGDVNGKLIAPYPDGIVWEKAPVVAPAVGESAHGEPLVKNLEFKIERGDHILITGANGTGKTGIARILAGLWPVAEGLVKRPEEIFFLPQRPYLPLGSLRDQIIYPFTWPDLQAAGKTDSDLLDLLEHVHLAYLPGREGGLDTRKEWKDVLSGGEKQRISIARLFFAKSLPLSAPDFAVLDEATSAVSSDVEGRIYEYAKSLGLTLITISHRPSLLKYHRYRLRLNGQEGGWELSKIGSDEERQLEHQSEIESLQEKLAEVDELKSRLADIDQELGFRR